METKARLITFGDSWTGNCGSKSWPCVLASLLKTDLVQNGVSGSDNKTILFKVLEQEYAVGDIVVVMWSHPWRVFNPYSDVGINVASEHLENISSDKQEIEYIKAYGAWYLRDDLGEESVARTCLQQVLLVQEFFKNRGILCVQCFNYIDMSAQYTHIPEIQFVDKTKFYGLGYKTMSNLLGGDECFGGIQVSPENDDHGKNGDLWSDPSCWTHPSSLGHKLIASELKLFLDNALATM